MNRKQIRVVLDVAEALEKTKGMLIDLIQMPSLSKPDEVKLEKIYKLIQRANDLIDKLIGAKRAEDE